MTRHWPPRRAAVPALLLPVVASAVLIGALLVSTVVAGCGLSHLEFVQDHRLTFVTPQSRATVRLPVQIRWRMKGFHGTFGVLVDTAPPPPGQTLAYLALYDRGCRPYLGCPNRQYLAGLGAYTTRRPQITLTQVNRIPQQTGLPAEQHSITVILLDGRGRRIGESAWYLEFGLAR